MAAPLNEKVRIHTALIALRTPLSELVVVLVRRAGHRVLEAALHAASEQHELPTYYRDCVRPLLGAPMSRWPQCCGRGCEPWAVTLVAVAVAVYDTLGLDDATAQRFARDFEAREEGGDVPTR
jgi:hypothetical protein